MGRWTSPHFLFNGWLTKIPGGATIKGHYRAEVWKIRREYLTTEYMNPCVIDDSKTDVNFDKGKQSPSTLAALAALAGVPIENQKQPNQEELATLSKNPIDFKVRVF